MMAINGHDPMAKKPPVTVGFVRDELKVLHVQVRVRSKARPSSVLEGTLDTREIRSQADIRKKVECLGGALAEEIIKRLKDPFIDPDECAKLAGKEWDELLKKPSSEVLPPE